MQRVVAVVSEEEEVKVSGEDERWFALGSALLVITAAGTVYAFGAFSSELGDRLDLSQEEVDLAALAGNLGNYLGLSGLFYDRFGGHRAVRLGATLIGVGYGGLWLLLVLDVKKHAAVLTAFFCFVWGHGASFLDVSAMGYAIEAFPKQRGAVVGLLKSLFGLSSSLIVLFAAYVFSKIAFVGVLALVSSGLAMSNARALGPKRVWAEETPSEAAAATRRLTRAAGRVLCVALATVVIAISRIADEDGWRRRGPNIAASAGVIIGLAWLLRVRVDKEKHEESSAPLLPEEQETLLMLVGSIDSPPLRTIRSRALWLELAAVFPAAGAGLMTINNLAQIIAARDDDGNMRAIAVSLVSVANCLGRLSTGRVADWLLKRGIPRPVLLLASNLLCSLAMAIMHSTQSVSGALCGVVVVGFAYGTLWTLIPTLAADCFGQKHFGSNYALALPAVISASCFFSTWLAASVYESHNHDDDDDDHTCRGRGCFNHTFLVTGCANVLGAVAALGFVLHTRHLYKPLPKVHDGDDSS